MWFGKIVLRDEFQQMKQYIKVKQIQVLPNAYVLNREVWRISRHTNKKIAGCIWLWTGCGEQIFQKCPKKVSESRLDFSAVGTAAGRGVRNPTCRPCLARPMRHPWADVRM